MGEVIRLPVKQSWGQTERKDAWYAGPTITVIGLGLAMLYSAWRTAMTTDWYPGDKGLHTWEAGSLLSPLFSPLILWEGMPPWLSPAMVILWMPLGFRTTCYYYRKAYYRAFLQRPTACSVGSAPIPYGGETKLFIWQNAHRYFMYIAVAFLFILSWDVFMALWWTGADNHHGPGDGASFGISIGTIVLLMNIVLLGGYTLGCHSLRHVLGGRLNWFSRTPLERIRKKAWDACTQFNMRHMLFAWASLFWVNFADLYVWMVASGKWTDVMLLGGV